MNALTVTTKGQITFRKDLLRHLGVSPGEKVAVEKLPNGRIEMRALRPAGKISDLFGALKGERPPLTIHEMNEIAAEGWAKRR